MYERLLLKWSRCAIATLRLACVLLAGCAGSTTTTTPEGEPPAETTSGGEATVAPTPAPPPAMRATVPIPVPQPARPRAQLSPELQLVWERVELAVALRPPEPPAGSTEEEIEAWASGPFSAWIARRVEATNLALEAMRGLAEAPLEERAVGAALFGYLYEDGVSGVRGAPVPEAIAADPELLAVYTESLNERVMAYARLSAQAYYGCIVLFQQVDDPAWGEWPAYCDQRGAEVVETFELGSAEAPAEGAPSTPDAGAPAAASEGEAAPAATEAPPGGA
jgi:hypothetical protein